MGHYDDIIEEEQERKRQEEERRRTARAAETKAKLINIIKDMDNDETEFVERFMKYLPTLIDTDMEFVLDIMSDLQAYRGFFKVLRNK